MTVANLKAHFSSILKSLKKGEEIIIEYGKKHEKLGVIIPYKKYKPKKRKIGILPGASFEMSKNFKITTEEFISL